MSPAFPIAQPIPRHRAPGKPVTTLEVIRRQLRALPRQVKTQPLVVAVGLALAVPQAVVALAVTL
jgi:hypothetical protein